MTDNNFNDFVNPFALPDADWDDLRSITEECPGVFYLVIHIADFKLPREMYAVMPSAIPKIISKEAIVYGNEIEGIYFFEYEGEFNTEHSGWNVIKYEILRYKTKHGIACDEADSLYSIAIFSASQYPEYFGEPIPPRFTPWGAVVRYKKAASGVFFLETDRSEWILALSYPVWSVDISDSVQQLGSLCDADKFTGQDEAEYLYFQRNKCAPAIFELLQIKKYEGIKNFIYSQEILETALYMQAPTYVIAKNLAGGKDDFLVELSKLLGIPIETLLNPKTGIQYIQYHPELANHELLKLPE